MKQVKVRAPKLNFGIKFRNFATIKEEEVTTYNSMSITDSFPKI